MISSRGVAKKRRAQGLAGMTVKCSPSVAVRQHSLRTGNPLQPCTAVAEGVWPDAGLAVVTLLMSDTPPIPASADPSPPCACRSGLRSDRCCALDWNATPAATQPTPEIDRARAALGAGDNAEAARLLIELLERFPKHLDALRLLYQIRTSENQTMAAEAL